MAFLLLHNYTDFILNCVSKDTIPNCRLLSYMTIPPEGSIGGKSSNMSTGYQKSPHSSGD